MNKITNFVKGHEKELAIAAGVTVVCAASVILWKTIKHTNTVSKSSSDPFFNELMGKWLEAQNQYKVMDAACNVFPNHPAEIDSVMDMFKTFSDADSYAVWITALKNE